MLYKGFTIIELLVIIAIFLIFAGISQVAFLNFQNHSNLEIATYNLVEALRHAKSNAQQVKQDTKWGIYVVGNTVTVFSGNSYASRNTSLDNSINLTNGISSSGLQEVVFEKVSGTTTNVGNIILTLGSQSKTITINEKGTITY